MVFMNFAINALCGPKGLGSVIITMCNRSAIATSLSPRHRRSNRLVLEKFIFQSCDFVGRCAGGLLGREWTDELDDGGLTQLVLCR